ncbi:PWWP domain-containing DNA repair factor 3A-like isoform 1-T1 [Thomomys bottae]
MESEDYVLCHWKGDLWPAKVLSRAGTQTHNEGREGSLLDVRILSVEETMQVRSTDVMPLTEAGIEAIASSAGLCLRANEFSGDALYRNSGPPGQASAHTEALKVALEILSSRKLAGQGTPVESPQSEPEAPRAQPGPGPCTDKKPPKRKMNSEPNVRKRACLPSHYMCHAGSEHALPVSVAHTATAAFAHEMQAQVSESSSVSSLVPTVKGAIDPTQNEKTLGAPAPKSSGHPSSWKCQYAKAQFPGLYMRPVVVLSRLKDQSQKGEDAGGEGMKLCDPHRITISPKGTEDSAKSASQAGLPGAGASSVSPNTWLPHAVSTANQKRKHPEAGVMTEAKKYKGPEPCNEPKATGTKEQPEIRQATQSTSVAAMSDMPLLERGMLVWFRYRDYPFWPCVVQSVDRTKNTARVLLIEPNLFPEQTGIQVFVGKLKPLECRLKDFLFHRARYHYGVGVAWCLSVITHYQEVVSAGNFKGSFLDYWASSDGFPVVEALENAEQGIHFPVVKYPNPDNYEQETFQDGKSPLGNFPECLNGVVEKQEKEQKEQEINHGKECEEKKEIGEKKEENELKGENEKVEKEDENLVKEKRNEEEGKVEEKEVMEKKEDEEEMKDEEVEEKKKNVGVKDLEEKNLGKGEDKVAKEKEREEELKMGEELNIEKKKEEDKEGKLEMEEKGEKTEEEVKVENEDIEEKEDEEKGGEKEKEENT